MDSVLQTDIRRTLLEMFTNAEGEYVSGQRISDLLGCSRTAVWKHIEDLRKEGYELEAVRKKGYRIVTKPNKVSTNELLLGLHTKKLVKTFTMRKPWSQHKKLRIVLLKKEL